HLRASDEKRREQTQCEVVRAINEQSLEHCLLDERSAIDGKLDADHQAFAANFANEAEFGGQRGKAFAQLRASDANVFEQRFVLDDAQKFESGGASQRAAAEGGAVQAGRNALGDGFRREDRAKRQACGKRLGYYCDIGLRGKFLVSEIAARASQTTLDFVGNKERAVLCGKGARAVPEIFADGINATFALNGLEEYGADRVIKFRFEIGDVVEAYKFDAGDERSEREAVLFRGSDTDGAKGSAMKGILERQNAVLAGRGAWSIGGSAAVKAGQLESALDGFRAAV